MGPEQVAVLDRLEGEHDNLRAALRWARERGAAEEGLRLAGALWRFWLTRGYLGEGRGWLEGALAAGCGDQPRLAPVALAEAGNLAHWQGDFGRAAALLERAWRCIGHWAIPPASSTLWAAWGLAGAAGRLRSGHRLQEESLALSRELGASASIAFCLTHLGMMAWARGEYGRALHLHEESVARFREAGSMRASPTLWTYLACVLESRGAHEQAEALAGGGAGALAGGG